MSSPPDVLEPVPMQVEIKSEEEPPKKKPATVSVTQDKNKIEVKVSEQSDEEKKALQNAKTVAEQASSPNVRKDAKQTLDKAKRNR